MGAMIAFKCSQRDSLFARYAAQLPYTHLMNEVLLAKNEAVREKAKATDQWSYLPL